MSVNTAHAGGGVLIHAGETILLFSDNVQMEFLGLDAVIFKGVKQGRIYLTTHRVIFNTSAKHSKDPLQSFSSPFIVMQDVQLEQPVFGANYIKGKIRAQAGGGFIGEIKFKMTFKAGGCIDFGQALLRAAQMAQRNSHGMAPPPYSPPEGSWYEAPPPAYSPNPGAYGWLPNNPSAFGQPPTNGVFMSDAPPNYPGVAGFAPNINPGFQGNPGFNNFPSGPNQPPPNYSGYPPAQGSSYPTLPQQSFGFNAPSAPMTKEQEATASAFYDPRNPNAAFVQQTQYQPPPSNDNPPPYSESLNDLESQIVNNSNAKKTQ